MSHFEFPTNIFTSIRIWLTVSVNYSDKITRNGGAQILLLLLTPGCAFPKIYSVNLSYIKANRLKIYTRDIK